MIPNATTSPTVMRSRPTPVPAEGHTAAERSRRCLRVSAMAAAWSRAPPAFSRCRLALASPDIRRLHPATPPPIRGRRRAAAGGTASEPRRRTGGIWAGGGGRKLPAGQPGRRRGDGCGRSDRQRQYLGPVPRDGLGQRRRIAVLHPVPTRRAGGAASNRHGANPSVEPAWLRLGLEPGRRHDHRRLPAGSPRQLRPEALRLVERTANEPGRDGEHAAVGVRAGRVRALARLRAIEPRGRTGRAPDPACQSADQPAHRAGPVQGQRCDWHPVVATDRRRLG